MSLRTVLVCLLAALAMFLWGFVFWTLPHPLEAFSTGLDNEKVQTALRDLIPADGAYAVPEFSEGSSMDSWMAQHRQGPIATLLVRKGGAEPGAPTVFLFGYLHMFATCLLIAWLLGKCGASLATFGAKVGLVAMAGFAGSFWIHVSAPIWMLQPWHYHLASVFYDVVAWVLAGLILAKWGRTG
ncbi:MAG TPA: hypothetical protein VF017_12580 [Thermoanaerobaculia bacterium]|nr:hypothetical protein [Thermoanaerobaculia bacterium]